MANDENYFETDLDGIGMPPEGEGDIDLDAVLAGNAASEGEEGGAEEGSQDGSEEQEDENLLDLENILNQEDSNGAESDDEGDDGDETPGVDDNKGTPSDDTSSSQDNEGASPLLIPFASLLHEQGVLPHLNIEDLESAEDPESVLNLLIEGIDTRIKEGNESYKNEIPEEFHDMIDAFNEGVPFDYLMQNKKAQLSYDSITDEKLESDVELQKKLVTDLMLSKGLKESRIKKLIERSEDLDELLEDAKEAKDELAEGYKKQIEEAAKFEKKQRAEAKKAYEESIKSLRSAIESTEEIIPGMKVTKSVKESTYKNMTEPVAYDEAGRPVNFIMDKRSKSDNPTLFDIRLNYLVEITNGLTDFSKINAVAETSATKKFLKNLDKNTSFKAGKPKNPGTKSKSEYMDKLLGSL